MSNLNKTILWQQHQDLGAKCTDFAGFDMPLNYGSQIEEHTAVRTDAGIFDVSHMVVVDIAGEQAFDFLQNIITNDLNKAGSNHALYTCMCSQQGGVIDDLIVYCIDRQNFRIITNAATKEKDLAWLHQYSAGYSVNINVHDDLAILSVQGPNTENKLSKVLQSDYIHKLNNLKPFSFYFDKDAHWFIARTGYTGEDGFELIIPNSQAKNFWQQCLANGIKPCGLAARDTLRLEAGMALYGQDMNEATTPLEVGLAWTVDFKNSKDNFIGKEALEKQKQERTESEFKTMMIGLILQDRGVLRAGQKVIIENCGEGEITSGTFSPTIQAGIAMASVRVNNSLKEHATCCVMIRNKECVAKIVKYPFVRFNKQVYKDY